MSSSTRFQLRDAITTGLQGQPSLSPPWLVSHGSNGERYMYTLGMALDCLLEKMNEAMLAKCPGIGPPTAIPLQAADRLLSQGPSETNTQFTQRLKDAFNAWGIAGSRRGVLGQVQAYLTNTQPGVTQTLPECLIVGGNSSLSTWDQIFYSTAQGASPAHTVVQPANWNWDGQSKPWRSWLVLFMHAVSTGQSGSTAIVSSTGGSGVSGVTSGFATITGLSGMNSSNQGQYLSLTGAASSSNNTSTATHPGFYISSVVSSTSVIIANPSAISADANNGAISWSILQFPFLGPAIPWGSQLAKWGSNSWGVVATPGPSPTSAANILQSIRGQVQLFKSAYTFYDKIIISFGGETGIAGGEFSPLSSQGSGNPDGTWGGNFNITNGVYVPAKKPINHNTSFCDGTGTSQNCYVQNIN